MLKEGKVHLPSEKSRPLVESVMHVFNIEAFQYEVVLSTEY